MTRGPVGPSGRGGINPPPALPEERNPDTPETLPVQGLRSPNGGARGAFKRLGGRMMKKIRAAKAFERSASHGEMQKLKEVFKQTYSGLYHVGAYDPDDILQAIKVFKKHTDSLDEVLKDHAHGNEISQAWKNVCKSGQEYLEWSAECRVDAPPSELVDSCRRLEGLTGQTWDAVLTARKSGSIKKAIYGLKARGHSKKADSIRKKVLALKEKYENYRQSIIESEPKAKDFSVQMDSLRSLIKKHFSGALNDANIGAAVDSWVRNILSFRGYAEAGLTLKDIET